MTRHAEVAYDTADDPIRAPRPQNPQELLALVEAARASTTLAMPSERRCSEEWATLAALHIKRNDTTHCQLCPAGHGPLQQTRWHILGQCQHPDLKDGRRKAALELQSKTHSTFTQKIKEPPGPSTILATTVCHHAGRPMGAARRRAGHQCQVGLANLPLVGAVGT